MEDHDRSPCGDPTLSDTGKEATLAGWVDALRDHGEVLFIHLRDRSGIVQVTMPGPPDFDPENRDELLSLRSRAYDLVVNGEELGGGSIRIKLPSIRPTSTIYVRETRR